jgi:peptidoglycan-associated lipoprotein
MKETYMRQVLVAAFFVLSLVGAAFAQSATQQDSSGHWVAGGPPYQVATPGQEQAVEQNLKDVRFDFDRYELTPESREVLQESANWLKANPEVYITIAGEADERGSIAYNLILSDQRAKVTRDALVQMGVPADRIVYATGWGKLYAVCTQSDESCWAQNRRAHFEPWQLGSFAARKNRPAGKESASAGPVPERK